MLSQKTSQLILGSQRFIKKKKKNRIAQSTHKHKGKKL